MDNILFLSILLSTSVFIKGDDNTIPSAVNDTAPSTLRENEGSFPHATVSSSLGSVLFIILIACLIYYFCVKKKTNPEGFSRFDNDNEGNPPRGRNRWRNRRFFGRNRRHNYAQNNPDQNHSTHVVIQPVVNLGIPSGNQDTGAPVGGSGTVPNMPPAPPAYNENMNNPPMSSQFINPPMPNQFINPPAPSQFMNPPMLNNFNNPPTSNNFNNLQQSNFDNPPLKNPNADTYYTRY